MLRTTTPTRKAHGGENTQPQGPEREVFLTFFPPSSLTHVLKDRCLLCMAKSRMHRRLSDVLFF
jgi:hypothetical protein